MGDCVRIDGGRNIPVEESSEEPLVSEPTPDPTVRLEEPRVEKEARCCDTEVPQSCQGRPDVEDFVAAPGFDTRCPCFSCA